MKNLPGSETLTEIDIGNEPKNKYMDNNKNKLNNQELKQNKNCQSSTTGLLKPGLIIVLAAVAVSIFGLTQAALADTHYVSPSGSASWTQCTNIDTLCSISTAMASAQAGDTVYFRGGTYSTTGQNEAYHAIFEPANSGTQSQPIVFKAYTGETPIISINCTFDGNKFLSPPQECWACKAIGTGGKDYISWDGFTLTTSNNHTAGIYVGWNDSVTHGSVIKNNNIISGDHQNNYRDNCDIIRIDKAADTVISNNKIQGFNNVAVSPGYGGPDNAAAIKIYGAPATNLVIENNEIYRHTGESVAISFKKYMDDVIIRNNYILDSTTGLRINVTTGFPEGYDSDNWRVYNNVFNVTGVSFGAPADNDPNYLNDFAVYNNTFRSYTSPNPVVYLGHPIRLKYYNNISLGFYGPADYGFFNTVAGNYSATIAEADHNQWGTNTFDIQVRRYGNYKDYFS